MHVVLYKYIGEKNRLNKSSFLSLVLDTTGDFKASVSILNPTLLLKLPLDPAYLLTDEDGDEIDDVALDNGEAPRILNFNYFYVEEFRRYYYLTSFIISSNHLATITGVVDPLFSFKDAIIENEGYIERNEFTYEDFAIDDLYPVKTLIKEEYIEITPDSLVNTIFNANLDENTLNIAVTLINPPSYANAEIITSPADGLPTIDRNDFLYNSSRVEVLNTRNFSNMCSELGLKYSSVSDYVLGAVAFPFRVETYNNYGDVFNFQIAVPDNEYSYKVIEFDHTKCAHGYLESKYLIAAHFKLPIINDFRDMEPITKYLLWIPYVGYKELSINELRDDWLILYYSVNFTDGSGRAYLYNITKKKMILSEAVQIGIPLPVTKTNAEQNRNALLSINTNAILGALSSSMSAFGNYIGGKPEGVISSFMGGVKGVINSQLEALQLYPRASVTPSGSIEGLYNPLIPHLKKVYRDGVVDLQKFAHQYGRPLREIRKLNTLSGFTLISSIHLEGLDAFDAEKAEIESSLLSGVLL